MHKQYYKDDTTTYEFNPIIWDFETFRAEKNAEEARRKANNRTHHFMLCATILCIFMSVLCLFNSSCITAAMNLTFAIVSFRTAQVKFARY